MRARTVRLATVGVAVVAMALLSAPRSAHAQAGVQDGQRESRRAGWAVLLGAYAGLGALTTGGAYLLRDNFVGRGISVTAGGWGGASLGAGAGYGLSLLSPCHRADGCEEERAVPVIVGFLLGGLAGSVISTWQTQSPGLSRPTVTALGMAPFFLFASMGTIFDW